MTTKADFIRTIKTYYHQHGRDLPWRHVSQDQQQYVYQVLVSEVMLQQTQVPRVVEKYNLWMQQYPTLQLAAKASFIDILTLWSGLGYNRRAKYLHQALQIIMTDYAGQIPHTITDLCQLPGIGHNTAAAILVYAHNQPHVFVETNIRTVYIHHFFADQIGVSDAAIFAKVQETLDMEQPREWYWALMDYGTFLKSTGASNLVRSKIYKKQSTFAGSVRQLRGAIIRLLIIAPKTYNELYAALQDDDRTMKVVTALVDEQLIVKNGQYYQIP